MRKITKIALLSCVLLAGCEKEDKTTVDTSAATLTTQLSANKVVLEEANASKEALTLTFTPNLGSVDTPLKYQAVFSYGSKTETKLFTSKKVTYTVAELNRIARTLKLPVGQAADVKIATTLLVGDSYATKGTSENTISINSYQTLISPSIWGVVGSAAPNGWDGPDASMWNIDNNLVAFTTLKQGKIKFRSNNKWDENYGGSGGKLAKNGADIDVTVTGKVRITMNLSSLTYKIEKYSWGIIGNGAKGWGDTDDIAMTYNGQLDQWEATNVELNNGEIKFRLNNSWGTNYGYVSDGVLKSGAGNIPVKAGIYDISFSFDEKEGTGTYEITKK